MNPFTQNYRKFYKIVSLAHRTASQSQANNLVYFRCQLLEDFVFFDVTPITAIALIVFRQLLSLVLLSGTTVVKGIKHPRELFDDTVISTLGTKLILGKATHTLLLKRIHTIFNFAERFILLNRS